MVNEALFEVTAISSTSFGSLRGRFWTPFSALGSGLARAHEIDRFQELDREHRHLGASL